MTLRIGRSSGLVHRLARAWGENDPISMARVLAPDVRLVIDHGGTSPGTEIDQALGPARVAESLRSVLATKSTIRLTERQVNGRAAIALIESDHVLAVVSVDIQKYRIGKIWIVTNPSKLRSWNIGARSSAPRVEGPVNTETEPFNSGS